VSGIEGQPIVDAYVQALREGEFRLSARGLSKEQAATLYELALRSDKAALDSFLKPLDMQLRLVVLRTEPGFLQHSKRWKTQSVRFVFTCGFFAE
jgi:hypothetical protein